MNKTSATIGAIVCILIGLAVGYAISPKLSGFQALGGSAAGTTFSTAKVAQINVSPLTATTTNVYNSDDSSRIIESGFAYCNTVGASTGNSVPLTLVAATGTTAGTAALNANTNYAFNVTIGTSTAVTSNASSTYGSPIFQIWPSGTYMNFYFAATNTAACTVGVHYVAS